MQKFPPLPSVATKPKKKSPYILISLIGTGIILLVVGAVLAIRSILASGITAGPDNMFGDQNLKTAVALIELSKVREGKYSDSMRDIKYTGQWDQLAIQSVRYYPNADRTAYYLEVARGWVGKPTFTIPPEFWKGTGYDPSLKPKDE